MNLASDYLISLDIHDEDTSLWTPSVVLPSSAMLGIASKFEAKLMDGVPFQYNYQIEPCR